MRHALGLTARANGPCFLGVVDPSDIAVAGPSAKHDETGVKNVQPASVFEAVNRVAARVPSARLSVRSRIMTERLTSILGP